ncbi:putative acyl-activating enzyme 6 [Prunus yedoensis var. nudiflora]|uniref:Putative acyl-activating enzyme 6 n=1 Tax=Prunus yedoensis var. nudiflora TaxID=2094558 RepID=A0A314ZRN9_PRUYE|nr:putative acyl-activating enzyme 6 [Prunus yedoensis var. nudiflora]
MPPAGLLHLLPRQALPGGLRGVPNTPAMYELHFAVPMSGAILNNINTRLDAHNISIILRHSESKLIFVDHLSVSLVLQALSLFPPHLPKPLLILITDDEHRSTPIPAVDNNYFLDTYENLVRKGNPSFEWVRPASEWAPMVLNYTSGTTSSPKGVVHSHRGLYIVTLVSIIDWSVPEHCVYLWTLPMFHSTVGVPVGHGRSGWNQHLPPQVRRSQNLQLNPSP